MSTLEEISLIGDGSQKQMLCEQFIRRAIEGEDVSLCREYVDYVLSESVPLVVSRHLVMNLSESVKSLSQQAQQEILQFAIERVQPRAVSYEEPLATMCEHLAGIFQEQEAWTQAANTLARIDLESGMRIVENDFKLGKYIKISTLYLEDGDASLAESYIKKASSLLSSCKSQALELQYRMVYARILDSTRRFLEACVRYYDLSQIDGAIEGLLLEEGYQAQALEAAVTCAILAAAGPQRSRLLATLYKDERTTSIPQFAILRSVYLERLLTSEEVEAFSKSLKPHNLERLPEGTTVLERSVIEHNLEACSKIYSSIKIDSLAEILHISLDRAQTIVANMIVEDRLPAGIDQVAGLVIFTTSASPMDQWNNSIEEMCKLSDAIGVTAKNRGIPVPMND